MEKKLEDENPKWATFGSFTHTVKVLCGVVLIYIHSRVKYSVAPGTTFTEQGTSTYCRFTKDCVN